MSETKLFIDPEGKFQFSIPILYEYKNINFKKSTGEPHAFAKYDQKDDYAFQISCKLINKQIKKIISTNKLEIHKFKAERLEFIERYSHTKDMHTYIWMTAVEDHFIFATFIIDKNAIERNKDELSNVRNSLQTVKFIPYHQRDIALAHRRYNLFIASTATVIEQKNKALEKGAFVEFVILTFNRIDSILRNSIFLKDQLITSSNLINTNSLYQSESDKIINERDIFIMALKKGIIDKKNYNELERLYKERNKVVHRYIITDIRTEDIVLIAEDLYEIEKILENIIYSLESEQFDKNIGIYANRPPGLSLSQSQHELIKSWIRDKTGRINIKDDKKSK